MKASLHNYRQSPRKVRLVADTVKGKRVDRALALLAQLPKKAALPVEKLIKSAVANSRQSAETLYVKEVTVNKGLVMTRFMPKARGRATPIRKRSSHLDVVLSETPTKKK